MDKDQLFSEIQSHMPQFENVWYERTEDCMNVYIADEKKFCVTDKGQVQSYDSTDKSMRLTTN